MSHFRFHTVHKALGTDRRLSIMLNFSICCSREESRSWFHLMCLWWHVCVGGVGGTLVNWQGTVRPCDWELSLEEFYNLQRFSKTHSVREVISVIPLQDSVSKRLNHMTIVTQWNDSRRMFLNPSLHCLPDLHLPYQKAICFSYQPQS
jgi:hypothetical protein